MEHLNSERKNRFIKLNVYDHQGATFDAVKPVIINTNHVVAITPLETSVGTNVTFRTVDEREFVVKYPKGYPAAVAMEQLAEELTGVGALVEDIKTKP